MNIIYTGGGNITKMTPHTRRTYNFISGVPRTIDTADEEFFKSLADHPGNKPWKIEGTVERRTKTTLSKMADAVESVSSFRSKRKRGKE